MKIIGGTDYYDVALATGHDDNIVFIRQGIKAGLYGIFDINAIPYDPPELGEPKWGLDTKPLGSKYNRWRYNNRSWEFSYKSGRIILSKVVVWFCGTRHGGIRWTYSDSYTTLRSPDDPLTHNQVFWSHQLLLDSLAKAGFEPQTTGDWRSNDSSASSLEKHFTNTGKQVVYDWLVESKYAIAVRDDPRIGWIINADVLKHVQFQRKLDAWQAFQELSIFVGNLATNENRMVEITDPKIKIAKHGFDKWSFRKMPAVSK